MINNKLSKMPYESKLTKLSFSNFLSLIFFLAFIDFILFSTHRILISFNIINLDVYPISISTFTWINYAFLFSACLFVFFFTFLLSIFVSKRSFKINIKKKTLNVLLFFLLISSIFIFLEQQNYKIRYTSGSITTFSGILAYLNKVLLICIFIIYQLNRKEFNLKFFFIIIISVILNIDGLGLGLIILSMILFEFYRLNFKKKLILIVFCIIVIPIVLFLSFYFKYSYSAGNFASFDFSLLKKYQSPLQYFYNIGIPRVSVHGEQLYSYISGDLAISNYNYLFKLIPETFNNRLKIIFDNGNDLFYPKTVGQSISFSMTGPNAPGGSSPGYVLSAISFLPFTIPLIFLVVSIYKKISFEINERINLIQVSCLCFILKGVNANLLDMLGIIDTSLFRLFLIYMSCSICVNNSNIKNYP